MNDSAGHRNAARSGRASFRDGVARIVLRARLDLLARRGVTGLFFGLLAGLLLSLLSGSVALPLAGTTLAILSAAAGLASGLAAGFLARVDARGLLIAADRSLATRELASTAFEIADRPAQGTFSQTIIDDAAALLAASPARRFLGKLRLPLLPFALLLAALTALSLLFPVNLRSLLSRPGPQPGDLAAIGEDLQSYGERLADAARAQNLDRSLALSEELAQLGRDLADRRIERDDALQRMSDLETRLAQEYARNPGTAPGTGSGKGGGSGSGGQDTGQSPQAGGRGGNGTTDDSQQERTDLADALQKLRDARRRAMELHNGPQGDKSLTQGDRSGTGGSQEQGAGSSQGPPGAGQGASADRPNGAPRAGGAGGADSGDQQELAAGSAPGSLPAAQKTGPPSTIVQPEQATPLRAEPNSGEGDVMQMLVRALPENGSAVVPEDRRLRQYAQQAESALARDEIPPKLKEYVKGYFTIIGMSVKDGKQ